MKELIDFEVLDEAVYQRFKDVSAYSFFHRPYSEMAANKLFFGLHVN